MSGLVSRQGDRIVLPGLATAHSHAFQRGLRARTQRNVAEPGSFWSWRGLMYRFAEQLDPASIYALARFAYAELALSGVTAVGEFHYVHHQGDGTPYEDRLELADAVIRAARDVGLRIALLRVLYHRAGADKPPEGAQRRFSDARLDVALADIDALGARFASDPCVTVGVAPHSVRAVPREWIREARVFARERDLPFHMHVAEQRREIALCVAEHGLPPMRMLAEDGLLDERFTAVHATHLEPDEVAAFGAARAFACICRTTERDLGDGHCDAAALRAAGARLCTGVDSHASSDPFEEARAIELDDRIRAEARIVAAEAPALIEAMTDNGYAAIGLDGRAPQDRVELDAKDIAFAGATDDNLEDAVVFSGSSRAVRRVVVAGREVVRDGVLVDDLSTIVREYETTTSRVLA